MNLAWADAYAPLVGRILMGGLFLIAGAQKAMALSGTAAYIASAGLPFPIVLAIIAMLIEVLCGVALIVGYKTKYAAAILAVFTVILTPIFHWGQLTMFLKNLAIIGGLLYMMTFGAGKYAADK